MSSHAIRTTSAPRRLRLDDINIVDTSRLKRALRGTVVGNTMEWYDVGVYGYLAVTMGKVFLPTAASSVQILFSLGVFAATYIVRPLGGIVFGRLGDKVGRQRVLATTLIMMASATFIVGLIPSYATIGAAAPVILVVMKLLQGFSTGGEYAGVTTFVSEYAPDRRRGFFGGFLDLGSYLGFAFGALIVSIMQLTLGDQAMLDYGWRIPFLIAGPIGATAVYFRLKIEESPAFQAVLEAEQGEKEEQLAAETGLLAILRTQWRPLLIAIVLVAAANTVGYALTSYMPTYLTDTLGYDAVHGTLLTIPVLVIMSAGIPAAGLLSDRIGRRPTVWLGAAAMGVLAVPAFGLLAVGAVWSTLVGLFLMAIPTALLVGTLASALPAQYPTAMRYGSMGISYNIAVAVFGGTAPVFIEAIMQATGDSMTPAYYLIGFAVVGAAAAFGLRESARRPLPGSMPAVETAAEAVELVETQDENELLDLDELPLEPVGAAARD
ncbi:MFS transporter [Gryllotalpicola ginsengisoli]|uniref:MFS transporter n=1 Tax=Gryllotalpicola ginsengisoli TaxID=444608 RepID=UPI0003B51383|nr:MFS transporter [Gryllotalpicola ginsengisoli]